MSSTAWRTTLLPEDWASLRRAVMQRDYYICQLAYDGCTWRATEVDHRIRGDNHAMSNLQAVCSKCHATKTGREANAARRKRKNDPEPHPGFIDQWENEGGAAHA